jgi:hypothetical protein
VDVVHWGCRHLAQLLAIRRPYVQQAQVQEMPCIGLGSGPRLPLHRRHDVLQ